jgi:ribosome maturation factor RimP
MTNPKQPQTEAEAPAGRLRVGPAKNRALLARIASLAEPVCSAEGLDLVHIEFQAEANGRVLRIYLDKPGGVMLEDCAAVSRQLSDLFDVELKTTGPYRLEVSSPGPERPLSTISDFERFKGQTIKVRTARSRKGRKNFTGTLLGTDATGISLLSSGRPLSLPLRDIIRARLSATMENTNADE